MLAVRFIYVETVELRFLVVLTSGLWDPMSARIWAV